MTPHRSTEVLTRLSTYLGGPEIAAADIEWALDLPGGHVLFERMASLVDVDGDEFDFGASTEAIALEAEERQIWDRALALGLTKHKPDMSRRNGHPTEAILIPRRLRAQTKHLSAEHAMLSHRSLTLKQRLKRIINTSLKAAETIPDIQAALKCVKDDIRSHQEQLAELSLQTDDTISSAIQSARRSIAGLNPKTLKDVRNSQHAYHHGEHLRRLVDNLELLATSIFQRHELASTSVTSATLGNKSWSAEELQFEAARLHHVFQSDLNSPLHDIPEGDYVEELERICERLEYGEAWEDILDEIEKESDGTADGWEPPNVNEVLEHAWRLDQAAQLSTQKASLETLLYDLKHYLLPPLFILAECLRRSDSEVFETAALVHALVEELSEIVDDLDEEHVVSSESRNDEEGFRELEALLKGSLNKMQSVRPEEAPPLILLDQVDVLRELEALKERHQETLAAEEEWTSITDSDIAKSRDAHAPLLRTLYANSSIPSIAPLSLRSDVRILVDKAKHKGEELGDMIEEVHAAMHVSDIEHEKKVKHRLDAFVEGLAGCNE